MMSFLICGALYRGVPLLTTEPLKVLCQLLRYEIGADSIQYMTSGEALGCLCITPFAFGVSINWCLRPESIICHLQEASAWCRYMGRPVHQRHRKLVYWLRWLCNDLEATKHGRDENSSHLDHSGQTIWFNVNWKHFTGLGYRGR